MPIVVNAKGRRPNETRPHEVYIGRQTRNGWRKSKWANPFRLMSAYVNHGRNVVHMINADKIYALQRSELLDSRTCNYFLSLDGRTIEKDDPFGRNTIFHSSCRGIWVSILMNEEEKPPIRGISQSLKDRFGDVVNDLI